MHPSPCLRSNFTSPDCRSSRKCLGQEKETTRSLEPQSKAGRCEKVHTKDRVIPPGRPPVSSIPRMRLGTTAPISSGTATPEWMKPRRRGGGLNGSAWAVPTGRPRCRPPGFQERGSQAGGIQLIRHLYRDSQGGEGGPGIR